MRRQTDEDEQKPILSWLGELPRPEVHARLTPVVDVVEGWNPEAAVIAIWIDADPRLIAKLPPPDQRPPVIAACDSDPQMIDRLEWIRAGAEDLVSVSRLIHTLTEAFEAAKPQKKSSSKRRERRLRTPPTPPTPAPPAPSGSPDPTPPTSIAPPTPAPRRPPKQPAAPKRPVVPGTESKTARRATVAAPSPSPAQQSPVQSAATDPFRALPVLGGDQAPPSLREWIHHATRYVRRRADFLAGLGPDALEGFLAICHMREHLDVLINDTTRSERFGKVSDGHPPEQSLGWPAVVRRLRSGEGDLEVTDGVVLGAGTDGLVLEAGFSVAAKQRLLVDLPFAAGVNAQVMLEARWQRPVARGRWQIGALIIEMRMAGL